MNNDFDKYTDGMLDVFIDEQIKDIEKYSRWLHEASKKLQKGIKEKEDRVKVK